VAPQSAIEVVGVIGERRIFGYASLVCIKARSRVVIDHDLGIVEEPPPAIPYIEAQAHFATGLRPTSAQICIEPRVTDCGPTKRHIYPFQDIYRFDFRNLQMMVPDDLSKPSHYANLVSATTQNFPILGYNVSSPHAAQGGIRSKVLFDPHQPIWSRYGIVINKGNDVAHSRIHAGIILAHHSRFSNPHNFNGRPGRSPVQKCLCFQIPLLDYDHNFFGLPVLPLES
jgi:hypothetical protein